MKLNTAPLSEIEIGVPVIAPGTYFAKIKEDKVEMKPNKDKSGNVLHIPVSIVNDVILSQKDGKELANRGQFVLTHYISMVEKNGYHPDQKLKELAVACKVPEDKQDFETSDIAGYVKVKVGYKAAEGQYQEGNFIDRVLPIKDEDNFIEP